MISIAPREIRESAKSDNPLSKEQLLQIIDGTENFAVIEAIEEAYCIDDEMADKIKKCGQRITRTIFRTLEWTLR